MEGEKPGPLKEPEQKAQSSVTNKILSIAKFMQGLETQAVWRIICHLFLQSLNMEMERLKKTREGQKM